MADYQNFQLGTVQFPIPVNATPIDELGDPAIYHALRYFRAMIEQNLGDRWDVEFAGSTDLVGKIVAEDVNFNPLSYLQEAQFTLPLLALFRTTGATIEKTVHWYAHQSEWELLYVFKPGSVSQLRKISSFLKLILNVIVDRMEQGYDPNFDSGASPFETGGVAKIKIVNFDFPELFIKDSNLNFRILRILFEVEEREQKNPGLDTLEGIDGYISISDSDTEVPFIEFQKDL